MTNNIKQQIQTDIQQAKATGQLRSERIREIVKAAVAQVTSELQEGSSEIRAIVKDAVTTVIENIQDKSTEIKEDITASIEGAIEGANTKRHAAIVQTQSELQRLQAQLDSEEDKFQQDVDGILAEISETSQEKTAHTKTAIDSAIESIKNSEEASLLKKRYAQLQAQLSIVRANLAARYGGRSEEVKHYLDEAQNWYNQARPQAEAVAAQVEQKRSQLEYKLGEAGTAVAKKERQIKQTLRELLLATADLFKDKEHPEQDKEVTRR
ncbi:histidine kinase [Nostoc sp. TCL26-01]|uniref:histidine kinase n=1 Tax=Nostoc sp. TCL26-01 TaxID=2576904 RepID=UPI0015BA232B|nr:histidine kinase [Nostoc sp. TCL26-01]QLE56988.1 histidine kinase [Nostoc sp. TCL26-01]